MKLLVVLALAAIAAAEPEAEAKADPYLLYGGYVLATTAMASATMVLGTGPTATTARGKLRLSPRLPLILTCCTEATGPTATATATPTAMAITTARGRLRLRPIPTSMVATTVMDWATVTATVLATGDTTTDKLL